MFSSTTLSLNQPEWISLLGVIVPFTARGVHAKINFYDDRTGRGIVTTVATDPTIATNLELGLAGVLGKNCPGRLATPLCACTTCDRRREALRTHPVIMERSLRALIPEEAIIGKISAIDHRLDLRHLLDAS
jgi:hypothetical protein